MLAFLIALSINLVRIKSSIEFSYKETFKRLLLIIIFSFIMFIGLELYKYIVNLVFDYKDSRLGVTIVLTFGVGLGGLIYFILAYKSTLLERTLGGKIGFLERILNKFRMGEVRLDKLLSDAGYGSRRDVKMLIKKSIVTVNDERIKKVNINVYPDKDVITVNGQTVIHEEYVYFMLNKPNGYLSATEDRVDPVVVDLIEGYEHYDLFPVGRLDKDTEGLLIITNDGLINHKLTSPNYEVPKTYFAEIAGV